MSRPTRPPLVAARRPRAAAVFVLAGALAAVGCISTPLTERTWLAVQTPHYDVWSSLGETETARLATELERFRVAAEFVWGREIAPAPVRTRVYAFDDRGVGRPFAFGSERSYLLPRQRGDLIVLRTGDGWSGDARTPLKLAYARRLFWNASSEVLPPWYEEGMPQLASTLEIRGRGADVGILRGDHVAMLRDSQWIPFDRLLGASDLTTWSGRDLAMFEAESWALAHYLRLGDEAQADGGARLVQFHTLIAAGASPEAAAQAALGEGLQRAVWKHVSGRELSSFSIAIPRQGEAPVTRAPSSREVREELGALALAIGETEEARKLFEQAGDPASAAALAGLGDALAAEGDAAGADARYAAARAASPDDPRVLLGQARLWLDRAARAEPSSERSALAVAARELYQRCIASAPRIPEGHAGLAETYLYEGDPTEAEGPLADARRLLPGDASIDELAVQLALARGDRAEAHREAVQLWTHSRSAPEREAAQALLDRVDTRAALR